MTGCLKGEYYMSDNQKFITGINYWPVNKAMYWWRDFDVREAARDFKSLAENNFHMVRIFLTWEDFQPAPETISSACLGYLKKTADLASSHGLQLMPTFFCGHMSGINWMPDWMLTSGKGEGRFPVFSNGRVGSAGIRNCYTDYEVIEAQLYQIQAVVTALKGHEAIFAYDLGNEASNWVIPPQRSDARKWLESMTSQIRHCSDGARVTLGMHAEDLEEDRRLWPQDAALFCDFLCMHGYPCYLSWVNDPIDSDLVPFLGIVTAWLGQKSVLFQEFGVPTRSVLPPAPPADYESLCQCPLWSEDEAAVYYSKVLPKLKAVGMMGAMAWCYADYTSLLWEKPPLDICLHERHFGMFRHDGSSKPAAEIFSHFKNTTVKSMLDLSCPWLKDIEREEFYHNPRNNISKLYQNYKEWLKEP